VLLGNTGLTFGTIFISMVWHEYCLLIFVKDEEIAKSSLKRMVQPKKEDGFKVSTSVDLLKFKIQKHPGHVRMRQFILAPEAIQEFFAAVEDINVERIEYVQFERFYLAQVLRDILGESFQHALREILHDRKLGAISIGVQNQTDSMDDYVKFSTAISHLVGVPNFDGMSGKYYARFNVKHTFDSDTYLRQAYRRFYLHTDGTFVNEQTDWVLMMKLEERNAVGGESLLLHLDDWKDLDKFRNHPMANVPYEFSQKGRASKNVDEVVYHTTFFDQNNAPCIWFNDQTGVPKSLEQAQYHREISKSLEQDESIRAIELPVGDLIMVNNNFWLHGRDSFEKNTELYRELLRQRGYFAKI
jgi:glutarate dioxygenase